MSTLPGWQEKAKISSSSLFNFSLEQGFNTAAEREQAKISSSASLLGGRNYILAIRRIELSFRLPSDPFFWFLIVAKLIQVISVDLMISQHLCSKNFSFFLKMKSMWAEPVLPLEIWIVRTLPHSGAVKIWLPRLTEETNINKNKENH